MDATEEQRFRDFAEHQAPGLRRFAYLLCGDWYLADDLMQTTLMKMYRGWKRLRGTESLGNYARTVLLRSWLDEKRRPWRRREARAEPMPDPPDELHDPAAEVQLSWTRSVVRDALTGLPPRQRATLVLRYYDELSVAETAAVLECSEGTVKSQTARGLAALGVAVGDLGESSDKPGSTEGKVRT